MIAQQDHLLRAHDGTIYCLDYGGRIRVYGPNGRQVFASQKSEKELVEARAKWSKEAD